MVIAEIMSIFQPSLKNLEKAKERKLDQHEMVTIQIKELN